MKLVCLHCKPEEKRERNGKLELIYPIHEFSWVEWIEHIKSKSAHSRHPFIKPSSFGLY